jgi:hypothetical protein
MSPLVTPKAQGDEILVCITTLLAPKPDVVDLQIRQGSTRLASPAIALEHSLAQSLVDPGVQAESRLFVERPTHAAGVTSIRNCCF